jgi:hypothetical protein
VSIRVTASKIVDKDMDVVPSVILTQEVDPGLKAFRVDLVLVSL